MVRGFAFVGAMAALMWVVEVIDQIAGGRLDRLGIEPREVDGLDGVLFAPFLHAGWDHLIGNTIPFLLLGFAIAVGGLGRVVAVTAIVMLVGGLGTWLIAPSHTVHIGASGVVFGYAAYLVARGVYSRSLGQIAIGARRAGDLGDDAAAGAGPRGRDLVAGPPVRRAGRDPRRARAAPPRGPRRHGVPGRPHAVLMVPLGAAATLEELETDPHPLLARLRAREPVSWVPALDGWLVTRRDLALQVMRDAGHVHGRRPALLDRRGSSARACSRSTAPSTAATARRSRARSGSTPCASASPRRSPTRSTGCSTRSRPPARPSCGASSPARSPPRP